MSQSFGELPMETRQLAYVAYVTGLVETLPALAARYDIALSSLHAISGREKWSVQREQYRIELAAMRREQCRVAMTAGALAMAKGFSALAEQFEEKCALSRDSQSAADFKEAMEMGRVLQAEGRGFLAIDSIVSSPVPVAFDRGGQGEEDRPAVMKEGRSLIVAVAKSVVESWSSEKQRGMTEVPPLKEAQVVKGN